MTERPLPPDLQDDESRLRARYRGDATQAPPALRERVLKAAAQQQATQPTGLRRWRVPMVAAASVLVAVALGLQLYLRQDAAVPEDTQAGLLIPDRQNHRFTFYEELPRIEPEIEELQSAAGDATKNPNCEMRVSVQLRTQAPSDLPQTLPFGFLAEDGHQLAEVQAVRTAIGEYGMKIAGTRIGTFCISGARALRPLFQTGAQKASLAVPFVPDFAQGVQVIVPMEKLR